MKLTTKPCIRCGKTSEMEVSPSEGAEIMRGVKPIQEILPNTTADERELIITGTHPECWEAIFNEDED